MNRILGILSHLVTVTFFLLFLSFFASNFRFVLLTHWTGGREYLITLHRPALNENQIQL